MEAGNNSELIDSKNQRCVACYFQFGEHVEKITFQHLQTTTHIFELMSYHVCLEFVLTLEESGSVSLFQTKRTQHAALIRLVYCCQDLAQLLSATGGVLW